MVTVQSHISQQHYRAVMGRLPTGVVAITGLDESGAEIGFIVGTFASLSLSPPLVTFSVGDTSSTWPKIRRQQHFTANVLASKQTDVCHALSRKGPGKFAGLRHVRGPLGTPRLPDSIAWIDCVVQAEVVAGDHFIVVGGVMSMESADGEPLLFQAGEFGRYAGLSDVRPSRRPASSGSTAGSSSGNPPARTLPDRAPFDGDGASVLPSL